jgi:Flp pilus assembly protein TadG
MALLDRMRRKIHMAAVQDQDGNSLIEFSATLGVMFTFVYVLMQICMALYTYGMISECAREATRWASVRGSTCKTSGGSSCTATTTTVANYAKGLGFPNIGGSALNPVASYPDTNEAPGSRVKVTITYPYTVNLPFVPKQTLSLQVSSEMYILQ